MWISGNAFSLSKLEWNIRYFYSFLSFNLFKNVWRVICAPNKSPKEAGQAFGHFPRTTRNETNMLTVPIYSWKSHKVWWTLNISTCMWMWGRCTIFLEVARKFIVCRRCLPSALYRQQLWVLPVNIWCNGCERGGLLLDTCVKKLLFR